MTLYPGALGDAIWLLINDAEITGEPRFLERAELLAAQAAGLFFDPSSPLPRASSQHDHYEAITRADTLMMAMLKLWQKRNKPELTLNLIYCDR